MDLIINNLINTVLSCGSPKVELDDGEFVI